MQQLERILEEWFVTKAPLQTPDNIRQGIVTALPWLALVGGLLMAWSAWQMLQLVLFVDTWFGWGAAYYAGASPFLWLWASLGILVVQAVLLFTAFPLLRTQQRRGWKLLFLVALINVAHAALQIATYTNLPAFLAAALASVIGLYLLFQVRAYYTNTRAASGGNSTMTLPKETPPAKSVKKKSKE